MSETPTERDARTWSYDVQVDPHWIRVNGTSKAGHKSELMFGHDEAAEIAPMLSEAVLNTTGYETVNKQATTIETADCLPGLGVVIATGFIGQQVTLLFGSDRTLTCDARDSFEAEVPIQ